MFASKVSAPCREYDVFAKLGRDGWKFLCTVQAKSVEDAKNIAIIEHPKAQRHKVAVYPKR